MANNLNSYSNTEHNATVVKFCGCTDFQLNYLWIIKNFSVCDKKHFKSHIIFPPGYENYKLKIMANEFDDYLAINVTAISMPSSANIKYKFSILNSKYEKVILKGVNIAVMFKPKDSIYYFIYIPFLLDAKNDVLFEDKLRILCEFDISINGTTKNIQHDEAKYELIQKFGSVVGNDKFSDIKIIVDNREISAHKIILAARSEVFAAMFEHEIEEHKSGRIYINDIKHDVLKEMLHFIYTGEAPNLSEMATDLLAAAHKYALQKLKGMCEKALSGQLSLERAVQTLILADSNSADQLKAETMAFIRAYAAEIMNTQDWINAIAEHPQLIATELSALLLSISKSKKLK